MSAPTGKQLRVDSAIPYASQIHNDSTYSGDMVGDALDTLYTTVGARLRAVATGLDLATLNDEVSVALGGSASDAWHPTFAVVKVASVTGTPATPAQITIGTASAGTQLVSATALTALTTLGATLIISFTGAKAAITADSTLYVRCTTAEGTASVLTADVYIYGEIVS